MRNEFAPYVTIVNNDCQHILWITIKGSLFRIDSIFLIGAVYIPPFNSKYFSQNVFDEMENEIISFSNDYQNICLMGDFNSRTSAEKDFVDSADFGLQDVDMFYHDVQELPNLGFL